MLARFEYQGVKPNLEGYKELAEEVLREYNVKITRTGDDLFGAKTEVIGDTVNPPGQSFAQKGQAERISFGELQKNPRFYKAVLDDPNASPRALELAKKIEKEMTTTVSRKVSAQKARLGQ